MKKILFFLTFIVLAFFINGRVISLEIHDVSLVNLIVTPEKYHKKIVRVVGVGKIEFENNALYLTKEHYNFMIPKNAIWLNIKNNKTLWEKRQELKKYNGKYVLVEGVFNKNNMGHLGSCSGSIEKVVKYNLWKKNN